MRYLVTGGTGFIGSALVRRLVADGHAVRVIDDMSRGREKRLNDVNCDIIHGDVRDAQAITAVMHNCDTIIHLAYLQGTQTFYAEPRQVLDVAIRGMLSVLDACEKTGCANMMLMSSSEAYQVADTVPTPEDIPLTVPDVLNPRYSYGGGKIACELMALAWQRTGVLDKLIIARPHNIYGPDMGREHVIPEFALRMRDLDRRYLRSEVIPFPIQGTGEETRSFCYITDCVSQLTHLLGNWSEPSSVYHIGTMDERTIDDVAYNVATIYDREIKILPGTLPKGSPPRRLPDTTKIRIAGWVQEPIDFAAGLTETVNWYRSHG
jgi:nucleoside-diphosphate-sugar epimerase